ncbi:uncharacterized protein LOC117477205 isoform X2 [Trematomus bernacchii]|uniref:uncharacterized protein LOC117477205 isoform X2 n=1 Tax=Trematomus bernacchii TaxID=40690 RepID=UPI00146C0F7B|nr:uncharacterized protein LOC117477205 isoform X2 [Trematomus bernacchii]
MVEFRRINTTLVVILLLQFTAVTGQTSLSLTVRAGHSVTLLCENVIKHQDKCNSTAWIYSRDGRTAKELINLGQISAHVISKAEADRLSVTEECSLVVTNITREDAGRYICRQYRSGGKQKGPDFQVLLSVIDMTQDKQNDNVTLFCAVSTYKECNHTVKWLYEGNQNDVEITPLACLSGVRFAPHLDQKSLKCNVTDTKTGETLLCDAGPQSSCQKTGSTPAGRNDPPGQDWLRFIIVSVGLAPLIIIVVTVTIWTRAKGNRAQTDDNAVHNDEDEGVVTYENVGEPSASIRLH